MEVAIETAQEQEACLEELRRCVREAPSRVDTRGMTRVLDQYQGTLVHPSYQQTKELLKNRIDRLIDRVSEIESTCIREMKEYGEDIMLLKWQYRTVMGMIGKGTVSLGLGEFKGRVEELLLLGEEEEFRRYIEVRNGIILCQWDAIEKTARGSQISAEERAALLEVLRQLSQGEGAIQQHNYNTFVLLFAKSGKQEWLEEMYQEWGKTFAGQVPPSGYDFFREALSNADRMVLLYRITEIQNSSQSEEEKVERIAAYLKEYGEYQEMLYIEVIRQKEIAAWLNKNGAVGEQAAAELGRMQIEWDIEQHKEYVNSLDIKEYHASWMVIDGNTYSCIRPYHGEIAGYTYMETISGPDDTAVGGYIYRLEYIPNDKVKQYNFNNKLTVGYNIFSKAYNLGYFNVYMPYMQAQYGQNVNSGAVLDDAMGAAPTHKVVIDGKTYTVKPGPNVQSVQSSQRNMKGLLSGVANHTVGNGTGGANTKDFTPYTSEMKKNIPVPEDGFQALVERQYIEIRKEGLSDVAAIAENTGLSIQEVTDMKKHLFLDTHKISIKGAPYDELYLQANPDIAQAWKLAKEGKLTTEQIKWFQQQAYHELAEKALVDQGIPLVDMSTWDSAKGQFLKNPDLNAHDKANLTAQQPIEGLPGYDFTEELLNNIDKKIEY